MCPRAIPFSYRALTSIMYRKAKIEKALREQVWVTRFGRVFESKCYTHWCQNRITVFDFQCGHDIPESKGGPTILSNLYPICARCNSSMGNKYTLDQWAEKGGQKRTSWFNGWCASIAICPTSPATMANGTKSPPSPTSPNAKHIK